MKTLSHLQNEAIERFEKEYLFEISTYTKSGYILRCDPDTLKDFLKTELETIVKESFKNTRVERYNNKQIFLKTGTRDADLMLITNQVITEKHNKECEFLGN